MVTTTNSKNSYLKLSIQVSLNGLSFCILDKSENSIVFFRKIQFQKQLDPIKVLGKIELEYENIEELNQPVDEVIVLFNNPLFSLVPSHLFDESNASNYLKFNTKILKTDFIAFDTISDKMVNVYIPYANITNYFFDKYGEFEYRHSLSVLLESLLDIQTEESGVPKVYLHSHDSGYELVVFENKQLIFANSFEFETKEDFLYYVLFTAEQLNLDPEKFELILFGDISKESEEYKMAWNYIRNISFLGPFHKFDVGSKDFPKEDRQEYLLLKSF